MATNTIEASTGASSSQPKRTRKPLDPKLGAIIFCLLGIFYIQGYGPDVLLYLLKDAGLDSLLAEAMAAWAALLWVGLMILLAMYTKQLFQVILWLLFVAAFGVLLYLIATWGASDEMRGVIWRVVLGFTFLTGALYNLSCYQRKLMEQQEQTEQL